jgi:hypothetical protein
VWNVLLESMETAYRATRALLAHLLVSDGLLVACQVSIAPEETLTATTVSLVRTALQVLANAHFVRLLRVSVQPPPLVLAGVLAVLKTSTRATSLRSALHALPVISRSLAVRAVQRQSRQRQRTRQLSTSR